MRYSQFIRSVGKAAKVGGRSFATYGEAERTTVAVLQALCDRLTADEAWDLLAQLPGELKEAVTVPRRPVKLSKDEFVARVAGELGVPREEARERIRAVFGTLRHAVTWGELDDVLAQLDPAYVDLLA